MRSVAMIICLLGAVATAALLGGRDNDDETSATKESSTQQVVQPESVAAQGNATVPEGDALIAVLQNSQIIFVGEQAGANFEGRFARFRAQVTLSETDQKVAAITAKIELASVDSENEERDGYMLSDEFFAVEKWPQATFVSNEIRALDNKGNYRAKANLTLRDQTRPIDFDFKFVAATDGKPATLIGSAKLQRLQFGVGQGEWSDTEWVADEVAVKVDLELQPRS